MLSTEFAKLYDIQEQDMLFFLPLILHVRKSAGNDEKEAARAIFV